MKVNGKLIFLIYVSLNKFEISIYKNLSQQLLYYKNTKNICIIYSIWLESLSEIVNAAYSYSFGEHDYLL